jgi:hypothetical protein
LVAAVAFAASALYGYASPKVSEFSCIRDAPRSIFQPFENFGTGMKISGEDLFHTFHAFGEEKGRKVLFLAAVAGLGYFVGYGLRYTQDAPLCRGPRDSEPPRDWGFPTRRLGHE